MGQLCVAGSFTMELVETIMLSSIIKKQVMRLMHQSQLVLQLIFIYKEIPPIIIYTIIGVLNLQELWKETILKFKILTLAVFARTGDLKSNNPNFSKFTSYFLYIFSLCTWIFFLSS